MKQRRILLTALGLGAFAAPLRILAQPSIAKVSRIGILGAASAAGYLKLVDALRVRLRELGYVEGRNLAIESRWAEGKYARLPELSAELVRLKVDAIVTAGTPAARATKQATTTIPIVLAQIADPIAIGIVSNLARPDGNITGLTYFVPELMAKRLELLKNAIPDARQVAILLNQDNIVKEPIVQSMTVAAKSLNLKLQRFELRGPDQFDAAFAAMRNGRFDGVVVQEDAMLVTNSGAIASVAASHRIPSIGFVELGPAGGLMGYGVNFSDMWRRAADLVDKILRGVKPSDIPIEQATKFELVINLRTAKTLGLTIPQSLVLRADEVIH